MPRDRLLWLAFAFEGGLALFGWVLGRAFGIDVWPGHVPTADAFALGLFGTIPLLAGLAMVLRSTWGALARLREATYVLAERLFAHATIADLVLISLLAGVGEEVFFRGLMQTGLAGWIGLAPAVLIVGLVFGLAHAVTPTYAVYAAIMGIYLGILLPVSGSLWVPVVAHAVYDLVALLLVRRRVSGG